MKNKWNKKISIVLALIVFVFAMTITAYAAGEHSFLQDYTVEDGVLQLRLAQSTDEGGYQKDGFSLSLSGQSVPVTDMKTIDETGAYVTYYCLVDVSSSMTELQMAWTKQILNIIVQGMKPGDNIVIATMGNTTNNSGFLVEPNAIAEAINGLSVSNEDTNLYAGIVDSLDLLNKDSKAYPTKCLIIFSDGQDDQKSGITQSEAENAVTNSDIPVYTVAILSQNASGQAIEYGKLLGSFARMSTGGIHYTPDLSEEAATETGNGIVASMRNGIVLYVDASEIELDKDVMLMRAIYTAPDGSKYEDTMNIYSEDLKDIVNADTDTSDDTEASDTEEADTEASVSDSEGDKKDNEEKDDSGSYLIYIIGGVLLLIIIIIAAVSASKKKKRKSKNASDAELNVNLEEIEGFSGIDEIDHTVQVPKDISLPVAPSSNENIPDTDEASEEDHEEERQEDAASKAEGIEKNIANDIPAREHTLRLLAIGYENIQKTIKLIEGKEITVGRTNMSDFVLISEDKRLSNIHCKICWELGKLYVCDAGSTNGTFVNGVPIKQMGRVVVHEGDTIRIGSYEYRVG